MYDPETKQFKFVPASFTDTVATFKRPGNSIYTVVELTRTFEDLNGHWAKADVELLASRLVVNGISADRFESNALITRVEFTSLLVHAMGLSEDNTSGFSDVKSTDWFAGAVNTAASKGFVNGYEDGAFKPNTKITREQMAVMIMKAMSFAGHKTTYDAQGLSEFTDSSFISNWTKDSVAQSVSAGVINGRTAATFAPAENATRAEAVVMLKRMLQALPFID